MASRPRVFRPHSAPSAVVLDREYEAHRRATKPWRALYKTARWQAIRAEVFREEPLCRRCVRDGRVTAATVVNHEERHEGDPAKFFAGPFEPLCKAHHDGEVQREERSAEQARRGAARVGR